MPGLRKRLRGRAELGRHSRCRRDAQIGRGGALDGRVGRRCGRGRQWQRSLHGEIDRARADRHDLRRPGCERDLARSQAGYQRGRAGQGEVVGVGRRAGVGHRCLEAAAGRARTGIERHLDAAGRHGERAVGRAGHGRIGRGRRGHGERIGAGSRALLDGQVERHVAEVAHARRHIDGGLAERGRDARGQARQCSMSRCRRRCPRW